MMRSLPTRRTLLKATLAGAVVASVPGTAAATSRTGRHAVLAHRIDELIAAINPNDIAITVAVSKGSGTVFSKGYGLADRGLPDTFTGEDIFKVEQLDERLHLRRGRRPSTFDTIYNLGSISKGFTSAAIWMLHERGRLSVHDPLGKHLPAYTRGADITLLQLMRMQSGVAEYNWFPQFEPAYDAFVASGERDLSPVVALLDTLPLEFAPGTKYAYRNTNYLLLGLVVRKVTGISLGRFLKWRVFGPLRMRDTTQGYPDRGSKDVALGYYSEDSGVHRAYQWSLPWLEGPGGLTGSARDLARWDAALLRPGLFRRETLDAMFTPGLGSYACGWVVQTHDGTPLIWHNSIVGGFHTMHGLFPEHNISVILLSNDQTNFPELERTALKVFDAVREIW